MTDIRDIIVTKANVHNLKNVSVKIPKNSLTVVTGPSGSGKSSLAFDTIYVEGQRRYIESLSSYARQFLGQYQQPDVESIIGLSPSIAIDQKTSSRNPRSTVGTITEIYDYLRVLFARAGTLYCPESGEEVISYTPAQIVKKLLSNKEKTKLHIMAPIFTGKGSDLTPHIKKFISMGFTRCALNDEIVELSEGLSFPKTKKLSFDVVIDRILVRDEIQKRLTDSIEYALKLGHGTIKVLVNDDVVFFSEKNISPATKELLPDLEPRLFSFNSPIGACPCCNGIGESKTFDKDLMLLDENLSLEDGAITPIKKKNSFLYKMVEGVLEAEKSSLDVPYNKLSKKIQKILWEGSTKSYKYSFKSESSNFEFNKPFPGIPAWLNKKFLETGSEKVRNELQEYMKIKTCPECKGLRLNQYALSTRLGDFNIIELTNKSIIDCLKTIKSIKLDGEKKLIAEKLLKEILSRLTFLHNVGLDYLTLNRSAATLSGGESQRIRLATQIGSALSGVLYVLDEPSIGLHQRDNEKLIETLKELRDLGNTVLVVEHDEDTMNAADHIIDMGPGAGVHGGEIVSEGPIKSVLKSKDSLTAQYLKGKKEIEIPSERKVADRHIQLNGAKENNLKNIDVEIPLDSVVCLTGVSGSGKSSLLHQVLVPAVRYHLANKNKGLYKRSNYHSIAGLKDIKSVIELDQSPIGRTPHSNPATYTGLFDTIRILYSKTPDSQIRGYKQGRFSFNVKGGRCEECEGNGMKKIEMHFLPDVYITCSECNGSRYNAETLSILYKGKSIADVLQMTIEEAYDFFRNHTKLERILGTLNSVGLGYMKLGQPATTLSGGEAQRLKLAKELAKKTRGHCLYILDEPTTGLHFEDIKILLKAIHNLVDQGNSVIIIEHNLDVIKTADYVIDLGPEGGDKGGTIVATGTPEEVSKVKKSETGKYLKKVLNK
ncbi:excinuclease ABC subunit UvrA [Halobacteriovorax sp. GB3]|uniref:excinuclease ABC subunit UvrA n=1 Tax=Halobacteriovorax sp. GB3 TaxID=2719615 RepID=UPI00236239D9|nr:excinuclease ABC subunit UvrA [Halobacteriovorax sp. GB3]MDD0854711.1 excinuclease ABC subunit UvrA [Halobacteriovorax sp. GB3]